MKRILTTALLLATACGPTSGPKPLNSDANNTPNNLANNQQNNTPNNGTNQTSDPPESVAAVTEAFTEASAVSVDFVAGLRTDGTQLDREVRDGGGDVQNERVRDGFENGVSGNSVVDEPGCVTYAWGEGLVVTVTFDGCTAEQSGEPINGQLTATVTLQPVTFALVLEELSVGATTYNGTIDLSFGEGGGLNAELQFDTSEGSTALTLEDVTISTPDTGGVILAGSGTVTNASGTTSFTGTGVLFEQGNCLPTAGELEYEDSGNPVTVAFLPTTPSNGTVEVTWPPLIPNPTELEVLPPCP